MPGTSKRAERNELPSQKVVLTVTENKQQLMDIMCTELINDESFHHDHLSQHKFVITGQDRTPVDINNGGVIIQRRDMDTTYEELSFRGGIWTLLTKRPTTS